MKTLLFITSAIFALEAYQCITNHLARVESRRNQEKTMAQIDDLTAAVDTLTTNVAKLGTDSQAVLDELTAIQAANPAVDLSGVIAKVNTINGSITAIDTKEVSAEPTVPAA